MSEHCWHHIRHVPVTFDGGKRFISCCFCFKLHREPIEDYPSKITIDGCIVGFDVCIGFRVGVRHAGGKIISVDKVVAA